MGQLLNFDTTQIISCILFVFSAIFKIIGLLTFHTNNRVDFLSFEQVPILSGIVKKIVLPCKTYHSFRITFVKVLEVFMERVEFVT